jgi:hypothetical protein
MIDTPNILSPRGAACMVGRDGAEVQIRIICETEDQAKAIIAGILGDIRAKGNTMLYIGGTVDEQASAGVKG